MCVVYISQMILHSGLFFIIIGNLENIEKYVEAI